MKILVDRHHADLLYSLQRLFEDRLGIEVFVPVGYEWWDEKIWQFGACFGDNRLAQQYLQISDGVWFLQADGTYLTYDTAQPERPIRGVTLDWFRSTGWSFLMPSVQENQSGYKRVADEIGARYLYHVGNTGQQIDWSLDPLVINTSEAPLQGKGVVVHQEIDSVPGGAFGYRPPYDPRVVRNAVNAFNRIPGYEEFLSAETCLREEGWEFTIHGHEGRDGDINPVAALGELMATAGWGWHQKPVGDGFGHVIHAWAAVGRPLVGRGAFYRGKLAESFWQDGVTCLDLDARPLSQTICLLREVAADADRHAEMCHAIRAEYDRLVDYEAEADAIRVLLGL